MLNIQLFRLRLLAPVALAAVSLGALSLWGDPAVLASSGLGSQISQLQQQESSIQGQLGSLESAASSASQQAAETARQVAQLQQQLATASAELAQDNAQLATTNDRLASTQRQLTKDSHQLSQLVLALYQRDQAQNLTSAIVDSSGVSQFVDNSLALQTLRQEFGQLTGQMAKDRGQLQTLKAHQVVQQLTVATQVMSLQGTSAQLQSQQQSFASQAANLSGQAAGLAAQLQQTSGQVAQLEAEEAADTRGLDLGASGQASLQYGTVLQVIGYQYNSAIPDDFTPGQCTWFVASQRAIPWFGNANQWAAAAALDGYPVGMTPEVGSVVVWSAGGLYDPLYGHVAYVVSVQSPTQFTVDEANFFGIPFLVDQRQIDSLSGVEGFVGTPAS